jgi:nucleoside-diphosphate-sugar epimerase
VGSYLVQDLLEHGARVRVVDDLSSGSTDNLEHVLGDVEFVRADLRDPVVAGNAVQGMEVVMHLAARAHGMLHSQQHHPEVLRDNTTMTFAILDACVHHEVERALMVSSSCVYPDDAPIPTPELPVNTGLPESVNEGYGWGKRLLEIQSRYLYEKHGLPIALLRPFNAYGGRYRWQGDASHVVPSLVKKVLDASGPVVIWGSGKQVRDLLHARDFALGFRLATECAVDCDPVNLAGGEAVKLKDLACRIAEIRGLEIDIRLDQTKPEGRARKEADLTKLHQRIPDFRPTVTLEEGLRDMFDWYGRNQAAGVF